MSVSKSKSPPFPVKELLYVPLKQPQRAWDYRDYLVRLFERRRKQRVQDPLTSENQGHNRPSNT